MSDTQKGTVEIVFANGFGNNLFQYAFGRLFAEMYDLNLRHKGLIKIGIEPENCEPNPDFETITISDGSHADEIYHEYFDGDPKRKNYNYFIKGHFEDFTLYKPYIDRIRTWYPKVEKTNTRDLIVHIRLHNRLLEWNHRINQITAEGYRRALEKFDFDKLYIVSDAEQWGCVTEDDMRALRKKLQKGAKKQMSSVQESMDYMNSLVDGFKQYDPIFRHTTLMGDFDFIRSFDKILVYNSTFAWWAAALSDATQVGVFEPWKPRKLYGRNKNLGKTDFDGWFRWGSMDDMVVKDEDIENCPKEKSAGLLAKIFGR